MPHPEGTAVDQLSYNYTARTNRLASVADAVETDLDWDAKSQIPFAGPSTFQYNRVGSMTQMTETLTSTSFRETEVQRYDERQLPEELQIRLFVAPGGMVEATQVSYRYDVNGQRIRKHVRPAPVIGGDPPRSGSIVQERYVRDGMRLIGVFDENNTLKSWNIGGAAGLVGRADPDPWIQYPVPQYYITDHLGSIRAVVNASGTVTEGRDYYPYGLTMPGRFYVEADTTREGFTGHELDKETGDYYAGARFYNPAIGRWFVVDPLADGYPSISSFGYVLGNPIILVDPDGQDIFIYFEEDGRHYRYRFTGDVSNAPNNPFVQNFIQAYNYLVEAGGGENLIQAATDPSISISLMYTPYFSETMSTMSPVVYWNPEGGRLNIDGTINSPSIALEHEMAHAVRRLQDPEGYARDARPGSVVEEQRIIDGPEYRSATAVGEPVRQGYTGYQIMTKGPTRTEINYYRSGLFWNMIQRQGYTVPIPLRPLLNFP